MKFNTQEALESYLGQHRSPSKIELQSLHGHASGIHFHRLALSLLKAEAGHRLKVLHINGFNLHELMDPISADFEALAELNLSRNLIRKAPDVSGLKALVILNLSYNLLGSLSVTSNSLELLDISNNLLPSLPPLEGCPRLRELSIFNNHIPASATTVGSKINIIWTATRTAAKPAPATRSVATPDKQPLTPKLSPRPVIVQDYCTAEEIKIIERWRRQVMLATSKQSLSVQLNEIGQPLSALDPTPKPSPTPEPKEKFLPQLAKLLNLPSPAIRHLGGVPFNTSREEILHEVPAITPQRSATAQSRRLPPLASTPSIVHQGVSNEGFETEISDKLSRVV